MPFNPRFSLTKGDVEVRVIRRSDAEPLRRMLAENRAWLSPWEASIPGATFETPGEAPLGPVIRYLRKRMRQGHGVPCVVLFRGEVVGQLSIADIAWGAVRSGQIGYWISREYAGRGITPTAVQLLIDHALFSLDLHRIEICLRPENVASRRVVDKLGLRYEGLRERYIYIDGGWRDHDCFAVTREERAHSLGLG
ncbi:GNAT family N-acetyltransferase [Leucobacter chinensis]|uniref:GNAT family N-acetyltransferase n=1 Tax=Leucobacter chinensis TaxID=2851010 RepID=UPI00350EAEB9